MRGAAGASRKMSSAIIAERLMIGEGVARFVFRYCWRPGTQVLLDLGLAVEALATIHPAPTPSPAAARY
jgi:hypothetical protein